MLEGFVADEPTGNRGVWVYSAQRKKWDKRPTRRTASVDNFYSFVEPTGERDDQLEDFLESLETPVAMLLARDIAVQRPLQKPHPEDLFVTFCAFLIVRNPATIDRTKENLVGMAKDILEEMTASSEAFQAFRKEFALGTGQEFPNLIEFERLRTDFGVTATRSGGLGFSVGMSIALREKLAEMAVDFMFAPPGGPKFVTGDVPFMIIYSESEPERFDQVVIPLSANITAIFNASNLVEYGYVDASSANVRAVNRAMLGVSQRFIISSTTEPFSSEILGRWAVADHDGRVEIVKQLWLRESGA
jgi:Protein of unknown function (DUF4238)